MHQMIESTSALRLRNELLHGSKDEKGVKRATAEPIETRFVVSPQTAFKRRNNPSFDL